MEKISGTLSVITVKPSLYRPTYIRFSQNMSLPDWYSGHYFTEIYICIGSYMLFWRGWMYVSVLTVRTGWQTWRSLPLWWQPSSMILSTPVPPTTSMSCQALKQPSCTMIELSWRTITSVPLSGEVGHFNYQYSYDLRLYIYLYSFLYVKIK